MKDDWKIKSGEDNSINFSAADMVKMKANIGDLIYISDTRKWLISLKSIHSVFDETHNQYGIVYVTEEHVKQGQFVKDKLLLA